MIIKNLFLKYPDLKNKIDNKFLLALFLLVLSAVAFYFIFYYFNSKTPELEIKESQPTMQEVLRSLTAPSEGEPISEEIYEDLSAPSVSTDNNSEVLESLTSPK